MYIVVVQLQLTDNMAEERSSTHTHSWAVRSVYIMVTDVLEEDTLSTRCYIAINSF